MKIAGHLKTDTEKAVAIFYWVRDTILYRVGLWNMKASETLAEKKGTCTNAANLFVALLRCHNIPAGYGVMKVFGKKYFGPVMLPMMSRYIAEKSTHIYACVYLEGNWFKVDPSDDYEFCKNTGYFNPTGTLLDWDGSHHAEITFNSDDIINDIYPVAQACSWISRSPKNGKGIKMSIANTYIKFLRSNTVKISKHSQLQPLFIKYLFKNKFSLLIPFLMYYSLYRLDVLFEKLFKQTSAEYAVPVDSNEADVSDNFKKAA
jgi:hypothetical protein